MTPPRPRIDRYLREREALDARAGDLVEITALGGPREFIDNSPTVDDYVALARRAYVRGDLTIEEFEAEIANLMTSPPRSSD